MPAHLQHALLAAAGGALGAASRFALSGVLLHKTVGWRFPLGTFVVNVLGCAVAGALAGLAEKRDWFSEAHRVFLFTGILGGFTTFSAFGLETVYLLQRRELAVAALYVGASVAAGLAALWAGLASIR